MMKKLVLLSSQYPFGAGETFLHSEIAVASQYFDKVIIIPTLKIKKNIIRSLPENVEIDSDTASQLAKQRQINSILKLLKVIKSLIFWKDLFSQSPYTFFSLRKITRLFERFFHSQIICEFLEKHIDQNTIFYSYWLNSSAYALRLLKSKKSTYFISRAHGSDLYHYTQKELFQPFQKQMIEYANAVYSISEDGKKYLQKYHNHRKDNLFVSYLGVYSNKKYTTFNYKKNELFHLISVSYLHPVKRINLIIEVLKNCSAQIKWTHIGSGEDFDTIQRTVKSLPKNIEANLVGHKTHTQVLDFYKNNQVDLFLNLSKSEGIPVSIMEAMSFSVPILATNVGGVSEIVNNNVGILLPANPTPKKVADQINFFFTKSEDELKKIRKNCFEFWNQKYNAKKNFNMFYTNLLKTGYLNEL
jgi:glycosyltransferase involved in cell wall biosynthesis